MMRPIRLIRGGRRPWRRPEIVCQQAVELVTDYLDDALSRSDRARFEAHLATCPHCREYLAQIRATIAATGRIEPSSLSPRALDELVTLYQSWRSE